MSQAKDSVSEMDRVVLDKPELARVFVDSLREAFRHGVDGVNHDASLYARPWRFRLQDITAKVHLWHGEQDQNVPVPAARYVAAAIPDCYATFIENESHLSLSCKYVREYLGMEFIDRVG